jgi:HSP20 family protein
MPDKERNRAAAQDTGRGVARSSQTQPAQRRSWDPMAQLSPGEFFANPFAAMRRMHEDMDRMFADMMGRQTGGSAMGGLGAWSPAVEISQRENELSVCAELPGLKPEDVKVEITDEALIIDGERRHEERREEGGKWHSERHYGHFHRTIPLPEGANTTDARAEFKNGELRVTIPVEAPKSNRRQIPISGSGGEKAEKQGQTAAETKR